MKTSNRYTTKTDRYTGRTHILDKGSPLSPDGYADPKDAREMCKELNRRHKLGAVDPRQPMDQQPVVSSPTGATPSSTQVYSYLIDGYPRESQEPAPGCELKNSFKNHDQYDTFGGTLVGTRDAIRATLVAWGTPILKIEPLTPKQADEMLENSLDEGDTTED